MNVIQPRPGIDSVFMTRWPSDRELFPFLVSTVY